MMTTGLDTANIAVTGDPAEAAIAQFEPDYDGTWERARPESGSADAADDPQWVVWDDAALTSTWVTSELTTQCADAARVARAVR